MCALYFSFIYLFFVPGRPLNNVGAFKNSGVRPANFFFESLSSDTPIIWIKPLKNKIYLFHSSCFGMRKEHVLRRSKTADCRRLQTMQAARMSGRLSDGAVLPI